MKNNRALTPLVPALLVLMLCAITATACIWDADSLSAEKSRSPDMAQLIIGPPPKPDDPKPLLERIAKLKAQPREQDASWWNDLAGAYLRLGRAKEAAELLEPVVQKFSSDYGIHANLGTAYHLLGRYAEAEKEIARDLEINPDAHFGLEKYHLALLQYLVRDAEYQKNHVYVYEWSSRFTGTPHPMMFRGSADPTAPMSEKDSGRPEYLEKWDLASDPKFEEGVRYMASLNPREPACFVMLGIACLHKRSYNLAGLAFDHAIKLGSPQAGQLKVWISSIERYVNRSLQEKYGQRWFWLILSLPIIGWIVARVAWNRVRKNRVPPPR